MAEKMLRQVLLGRVHQAVVTRAVLDGDDGLTLDAALLEAAGFVEFEKVELSNVTTGVRCALVVRAGEGGSGEVSLTGAAGHLAQPGELVTIANYGWVKGKALAKHEVRDVRVTDENRVSNLPATEVVPSARVELDPFERVQVRMEKRARRLKAKRA